MTGLNDTFWSTNSLSMNMQCTTYSGCVFVMPSGILAHWKININVWLRQEGYDHNWRQIQFNLSWCSRLVLLLCFFTKHYFCWDGFPKLSHSHYYDRYLLRCIPIFAKIYDSITQYIRLRIHSLIFGPSILQLRSFSQFNCLHFLISFFLFIIQSFSF